MSENLPFIREEDKIMMTAVFQPIQEDIQLFGREIEGFLEEIRHDKVRQNFRVFFEQQGKHIRPSLLFLSVRSLISTLSDEQVASMHRLGLVLELLHSASLVHDDIVDGDDERRGHATIHKVFSNKIGVLAGDTLFSYAFMIATRYYEKPYNEAITSLAYAMCEAELIQANGIDHEETYLKVIEGKTARFMEVACYMGGLFGQADDAKLEALKDYGHALGMAYQIMDDLEDLDANGLKYGSIELALSYYERGMKALRKLEDSLYRQSLEMLLNLVVGKQPNN